MKISKSKQELARIISENGGWRDWAESAAQCKSDNAVSFYRDVPDRDGGCWWGDHIDSGDINQDKLIANWHQTILSRAEYFHLYPAPDADGWVEWKGGKFPALDESGSARRRDGVELSFGPRNAYNWRHDESCPRNRQIVAYRLHKPEQAKPEFCESVMRTIPEPEAKPTIEQLATDYRSRKDYADRKQQEADDAKDDAEAKLAELVAAGKVLGLVIDVRH